MSHKKHHWQPIETAPRDEWIQVQWAAGEEEVMFCATGNEGAQLNYGEKVWWRSRDGSWLGSAPTAWKPIHGHKKAE